MSNARLSAGLLISLLCLLAPATSGSAAAEPDAQTHCVLSPADRAWLDRSIDAWKLTSSRFIEVSRLPAFEAVIFSADCVLRSDNALNGTSAREARWTASPHAGTVRLPDGGEVPAGITSFTSGDNGLFYFVMSTPSVWRAGGLKDEGGVPLETTMVGVLLHEASHVAQIGPYGPRLGALIERHSLPDSFSDDSLQIQFRSEAEFADSVARETALFARAADAADRDEAVRLAREARALMRARQARWFVGEHAYYVEAEGIWLTFEGSGQWAAYRWLTDPNGAALSESVIRPRFLKPNGWWSQIEGFAVVSAVDRIVGPGWKDHAFGDGRKTILEILDAAIAPG